MAEKYDFFILRIARLLLCLVEFVAVPYWLMPVEQCIMIDIRSHLWDLIFRVLRKREVFGVLAWNFWSS